MGSERPTLFYILILCVLTGVQGFCMAAIHPDLEEVAIAIRVTYDSAVLDVSETFLAAGANTVSISSGNWTGGITFKASFTGANQFQIETTIGGITQGTSSWITWNGSGYAGSYETTNGYLIEIAESGYFDDKPTDPEPQNDEATTEGILLSLVIGILLWQVFARSMRERSVMW